MQQQQQQLQQQQQQDEQLPRSKCHVLYIMTSLAEYHKRTRESMRNFDRLQEITMPIIVEGVSSMISSGYSVDIYFICHYTLTHERQQSIQNALDAIILTDNTTTTTPRKKTIGLTIWDDATPMGYDRSKSSKITKLQYRTVQLSRQHRFVIKDNIVRYDMFVNFEDDMLIKGDHLNHFRAVTAELDRLYQAAPDDYPAGEQPDDVYKRYYGIMTKGQLQRMILGFMRTEVLVNENKYPAQSNTGPVLVDSQFDRTEK